MQKKVLFLIHTLGAGGAEKVLVNLVNNISSNYDVTVMTVIDTGIYKNYLNENIHYKTMFKIPRILRKKEKNTSGSLLNKTSKKKKILAKVYSFFWKIMPTKLLYRLKIREKYDVEVAFLEGICAKIISSSNQKSKKLSWIHVDMINEKKSDAIFWNKKSAKKCYEKFDRVVSVSNEVRSQFIKKFDFDSKKVVVKYNPIDVEEIVSKSKEKIEEETKKFNMISVGRLSKQKGYDRLLKIVKKLKEDGFDFKLSIIGIGPKEEELKNYIKENELEEYVSLLGFKANPFPYVKKSDLFVCSSRAEGFSTVACEAAILGIPIVTTNCSGMEELLGNSEYGLITDNEEEPLYVGLKSILADNKLYELYKQKIKKLRSKFDVKSATKNIEELFED